GWSTQPGAGVSIASNAGKLYVIGAAGGIYATSVTAMTSPETLAIASNALSEVALYTVGASSPSATISAASLGLQSFSPDLLALDAQNDLFVADGSSTQVLDFAPPYTGTPKTVLSGTDTPEGLAVTSTGTVFDASFNALYSQYMSQPVQMSAPPYTSQTNLALPSGNNFSPYCLAVDGQGNLFATNAEETYTDPGTLEYMSPYTGTPTSYSFGGNWGYPSNSPPPGGGCVVDTSNGELFVGYASTIEAYAPPYSGPATVINEGAMGNSTMAVSSTNHDFFVANGTSVDVYAPPYTSKTATITLGVSGPTIVAADASGNLFVASWYNGTITEYAPPYTGAPIWTLDAFGQSGSTWLTVIP
ncbi:MAG: NHL repeat-containing protein, partial [Vulcanimicrobiaceae bacterium]